MAEGQGRSSNQGVKLLYIRDYLRKYTDKEHPKSATDIKEFLASRGIKADRKTIYNDILRLQMDFQEPIEYNKKKWGYYITQPMFETKELRMLIDCVQLSSLITEEESNTLSKKIMELGTVYSKDSLEKYIRTKVEINKPEESVFQKVEIILQAISAKKKIGFCYAYPALDRDEQGNPVNYEKIYKIVSPKHIRKRNGFYALIAFADEEDEYGYAIPLREMENIKILSFESNSRNSRLPNFKQTEHVLIEREHYSFDPEREYAVTILLRQYDIELVKRRFGNDVRMIPYDYENMMITIHTKLNLHFFEKIKYFGKYAMILSPKEAIGEYFEYIKKGMKDIDELYGYGTPEFLKDVPSNYDDLRAKKHHFKHHRRKRKTVQ